MIKNILPPTTKKAAFHTCNKVNQDIRNKTVRCIDTFKDGGEKALSDKIGKLEREWDTERYLETNAASIIFLTSLLCCKKSRAFVLTGAVGLFMLQHALQGWCPPLPIIRKLGVRSAEEINNEKTALKLIRGDFSHNTNEADALLGMAEKN